MITAPLRAHLASGKLDRELTILYGSDELDHHRKRYLDLLDKTAPPPDASPFYVSVPGRTELGGNHTDHNHGRVLAAAINRDCVGLIYPIAEKTVSLHSAAMEEEITVDLHSLEPVEAEQGSARSLVRGVAAAWSRKHTVKRGFTARLDNRIPIGGGLSSSAAFGLLVGAALSQANDVPMDRQQLAHFAHEAENRYFGKPCGLMDQLSCSIGGLLAIDFHKLQEPLVEQIPAEFEKFGYRLLLIDTGSSHAELTSHYAAIPQEMKLVAEQLGVAYGRDISTDALLARLPELRGAVADRAILRMLHFLLEDQRAARQSECLKLGKFEEFLELVRQSADSSWRLLQNCQTGDAREQPVALGIVLSQIFCPQVVARVHGGGFAGAIQVWVPAQELDSFNRQMEKVFGTGCVVEISIGRPGITIIGEAQ